MGVMNASPRRSAKCLASSSARSNSSESLSSSINLPFQHAKFHFKNVADRVGTLQWQQRFGVRKGAPLRQIMERMGKIGNVDFVLRQQDISQLEASVLLPPVLLLKPPAPPRLIRINRSRLFIRLFFRRPGIGYSAGRAWFGGSNRQLRSERRWFG